MNESPEEIRERVLAEESEKGSDPRVAEGRAKAAELRAREGLPIDPQEAWPAKLEREGGGDASETATAEPDVEAPEAETPDEQEAQPEPEPEAPKEEEAPTPEADEADETGTAPTADIPGVETEAPAPATAPQPVAAAVEPETPPEIGDPIDVTDEVIAVVAGIKVRDARLPTWMVIVMAAILIWAATYLVVFSFSDSAPCEVHADQTFTCAPAEEPPE